MVEIFCETCCWNMHISSGTSLGRIQPQNCIAIALTDQRHFVELCFILLPSVRECGAICCNSYTRRIVSSHLYLCGQTILTSHSSVPTQDHVLVPETLLKKRKSQEAARAERRAEAEQKKKVGSPLPCLDSQFFPPPTFSQLSDDNTNHATRPLVNAVAC